MTVIPLGNGLTARVADEASSIMHPVPSTEHPESSIESIVKAVLSEESCRRCKAWARSRPQVYCSTSRTGCVLVTLCLHALGADVEDPAPCRRTQESRSKHFSIIFAGTFTPAAVIF
jgi:hypothetical protein